MDTDRLKETKAFILKEVKYGNSSRIVEAFTRDMGRISIMAKGAYRKNSPIFSLTNPYNIVEINLTKGKNFYYVKDGNVLFSPGPLKKSAPHMLVMSLAFELIEQTTVRDHGERDLFDLTFYFFKALKEDMENLASKLTAYLLKYMAFLGYKPSLSRCLSCGNRRAESYILSYAEGGIICSSCLKGLEERSKISLQELNALENLLYRPIKEARDVEDVVYPKLVRILLEYISKSLELKDLRLVWWLRKFNLYD